MKKTTPKSCLLNQKFRHFRNFSFTAQKPKWQNSCSPNVAYRATVYRTGTFIMFLRSQILTLKLYKLVHIRFKEIARGLLDWQSLMHRKLQHTCITLRQDLMQTLNISLKLQSKILSCLLKFISNLINSLWSSLQCSSMNTLLYHSAPQIFAKTIVWVKQFFVFT